MIAMFCKDDDNNFYKISLYDVDAANGWSSLTNIADFGRDLQRTVCFSFKVFDFGYMLCQVSMFTSIFIITLSIRFCFAINYLFTRCLQIIQLYVNILAKFM